VFDLDEAMNCCFGSPSVFEQMVEHFLTTAPGLLTRIRAALRAEDRREIVQVTQVLRETLIFLAAHPAEEAADKLENLGTGGAWGAVVNQFLALQHQVERLDLALARHRKAGAAWTTRAR
jgi:HPt (histidine-containing phosphotransfer) domain-containing protein